jgi:hypothetical protein
MLCENWRSDSLCSLNECIGDPHSLRITTDKSSVYGYESERPRRYGTCRLG